MAAGWIGRTVITLTAAALVSTCGVMPAVAAQEQAAAPDATDGTTPGVVFQAADPQDYAADAAALPSGLVEALDRDLGLSPAEYLAEGVTAVRAADVVDALDASGVEVLGSKLEGSDLVVYVPDQAEADAVDVAGVRTVIGEPEQLAVEDPSYYEFKDDVRAGTPYIFGGDGRSHRCSLGFAGYQVSTGASRSMTAGHCLGDATSMRRTIGANRPNSFDSVRKDLGLPVPGSYRLGDGYDHGLIGIRGDRTTLPEVLTWGGRDGAPLASTPVKVRDAARAVVGANLCRSGSTSGWHCGEIVAVDARIRVGDAQEVVDTIAAQVCLLSGDSGGPALSGTLAVGINSASARDDTCTSSDSISFFSQLYSGGGASAERLYDGDWEPAVAVAQPVVTTSATEAVRDGRLRGTLPYGSVRHRVVVVIDGDITRTATVASNGTWSVDISDLPAGRHTYSAQAWWGTHSHSGAVTGQWGGLSADRIAGADRVGTAVEISKQAFPATAPIVFVASSANYPDALSAGPVAAVKGGPLLLTPGTQLPKAVRDELKRLDPRRIVVVGGPGAVSESVKRELGRYAPKVERIGGADRYETSRRIAAYGFSTADKVFLATGRDFPDALSAGAAGAAIGAPIVLIDGQRPNVDAATAKLLRRLDPSTILVAGGTGAVSKGAARSAAAVARVERLAGASRYDTSLAINDFAFDSADRAFFALGTNFPDALAGGVLAGRSGAPMYITPQSCVPGDIVDHVLELDVTRVTILGGRGALSDSIGRLDRC